MFFFLLRLKSKTMRKYLNLLLSVFILFIGCTVKHLSKTDETRFVEYVYNDSINNTVNPDSITEKFIKIQLPKGVLESSVIGNNGFFHLLNFEYDQKIAFFLMPGCERVGETEMLNLSYSDFKDLCVKEKIIDHLKNVNLKNDRLFGFKKFGNGRLCMIYLNVKTENIDGYNFSIRRVKL